MRRFSVALLFVSIIALASAQMVPTWEQQQAPQPIPYTPTPAPAPVQLKPLFITLPGMFVPAFDQFASKLLLVAQAKIPQLDVKRAERGISRIVAAFAFLHVLPFDRFIGAKTMSLDRIAFVLEAIKNGLSQFVQFQHNASAQNGVVPEEQKAFGQSLYKIAQVLDLLKEKIQQIKNDSIAQDQLLKEQLSNDGRRLKSLKN